MKLKKNKFIIGLSTTLLGSVIAAGGEVAHASALPEQTDLTPTKDIVENFVDEYSKVIDNEEPDQLAEENSDSAETNEAEVSEESAQASDSSEAAQADATDKNEASTTNETEQTDTEEDTDQATEATGKEEALLTEPSATTEDPAAVEEPSTEPTAEEETAPETNQGLNTEVEAGAVVEDEDDADPASTEADPVDEDSTEKAQELEANNPDTTNNETYAATSTEQKDDASISADTPQETPAGDEPLKEDPEAGDAPLDGDGLSTTDQDSDLPKTEEGATLPLTSEGADLTEAGAEVPGGETNTEKPADTDPQADEANIKAVEGSERYRETDLSPGDTVVSGGKDDFVDPKDGFKAIVIEPSNNTTDKRLYGYELIIDKKTGQRTYTRIEASSSVVRWAPATLGNKLMTGKGYKDPESSTEVIYEPTGPSTLSPGTQNVYGYLASEDDLKFINNKDINSTVLGMKDYYTKDNENGPHVLDNANIVFKVNPWPDENDELKPIKLNGEYNEKVFVQGQLIETGLKVENVDTNAKERLTGKVYHPTTGKIVPGAEAFIDVNGNVFVRLPAGAVDADGNINEDSIFYKDKEYKGIQSLDVKFYARPRMADEFQKIAESAEGGYPGTYVETGAGTTDIIHNGKKVPIANQGIDRYDHYNYIGGFSINLDDTKDHDQAFVDQDGTLTEDETASYVKPGVPYKVTNNDGESIKDITDAVSKERANAKLDLTLIEKKNEGKAEDDQWKVEGVDEALTDIKITAPKNAKAGDFVSFSVRYTYTNGSVDNHKLTFIVKEPGNNIPQYYSQVLYPTEEVTSLPHLSIKAEDQEKRRPVEYTIEKDTYTDDHGNEWTAKIDPKTGIVTVDPKTAKDFIGGEKLVVPVTVRYVEEEHPDITFTEEVRAAFVVKQKLNSLPIYDAKNGEAGESLTSTPAIKGDAGIDTRRPTRYSIANTEYTDNKGNVWTVSIDEKTGKVTANIPDIKDGDKLAGTIISVPVTAHYSEDGQEVGTREATAQFLAYGTNNTIEHKEKIPFDTIVEVNNDLAKGEWRYKTVDGIEQKGQLGEIKTTWTIENSKIVDTTEERTEPVAAIIEIGQKDYSGTLEYVDKDSVPFETEVTIDPNLEPNQIVEDQAGVLGEQETKVTRNITNGVAGEEVRGETTQTKAPVNRKIRIGAQSNGTQTIEEKVEVPFETVVEFDDSLAPGEQKVTQEGIPGEKTRTTTLTIVNGEVTETKPGEFTETKAPTNKIIKVGRNTEGKVEHKEAIPFDYKVEYDPTIKAGEYKIEVPGKAGKRTTEWTIRNSEIVGQPTVTVVDPVKAVIKVGNKDFTGEVRHTEDFAIPYTVEIKYNPELPVGTTNVTQQGKAGSYKVTYTQNIKNGETTGELVKTESDRVKAQNQIIEIGTKAVEPNTTTVTSPVQPAIDLEYNPELAKGDVQKGEITPGEVKTVVVTTRDPETGQLVTKEETIQTAPRQKIIVGTKDFTGDYKYTEEKIDEYKTTVIFDPTLAPGKEEIETPGVNGVSRREVTVPITNGTAGTPSYGNYEEVTKRQDQVIRVGTRTDGKHTVTEVIPYGYTIEEVDTLPKGEYREVSPGQAGSRTVEYEIVNSKVVEGSANEISKTNPVNAVIQVGKGTLNGTHTITETEVVPYETEIVFDDTLKAGEEVVENQGSNGSKSRKVTLTIEDGKVVSTDEGAYTEDSAPVNRKVRVGTLTEGTITHEEKIPFTYEITYDPTVAAGTYVTDVEGKEGTRTTTWTITNSTPVKTGEVTEGPTNAKIRVGSKDFTGTVTNTTTEPIPYKVIVRENPNMKLGTSKTVTDGVVGSKEVTYNIPVKNGEKDPDGKVTSSEVVKTEAVDQVIEVGTKPVDPVKEDVSETIDVIVKYEFDPELPKGETRTGELTQGKVENVVTTVYNPQTGQMETREDKKVTPAVQTIYVGSKDLVGKQEFVVTQEIPFETEYIEDPNLEAGKTEVEQQGQTGEKTVTYKAEAKNGTVTSNKVTEEITTQPVKQIIRVGTKSEETDTKVVVESIPFEIKYEYTDELEAGKIEVVKEGELGEKTITTTTTTINGVSTTDTKEETTKEAVNRVVRVGTKIDRQTTDVVGEETTIIPYKTTVIYDPNLKAGEKIVDKQGVNGERKITVTVPVVDGVAGDPVVKTEDIVQAQDEIIRVGTRDDSTTTVLNTTTTTESIAFTTRYVEDETLDIGQTVVETPGQFGSKTVTTSTILINGEAKTSTSDNVTKNPVEQVVRVGTKVPNLDNQTVKETEDIEVPYSTVIQYNDQMDVGSSFVAQEGENGTTTITTTVEVVDGVAGKPVITTTTKDPKTRIVQIGSKPVTETVKSDVEFETEVIFDDTLPIGEERVEEGELGEDTTTITHELVNGQVKASTETKRTKEPKKQIIRVGTKAAELTDQDIEDTRTIEIPYTTRIIYDDTLDAGTERVDVEGKNGERIITYKVEVRDGIATDAKIVDERRTEPTEKVIRIGTRRTDTITTVVETVKPFETKIVYDPEMPKGTSEVTQEGKNGIKRETIVSTRINGADQENPAVTVSETDAIDQIITVGTKCDDQVATIDTEVEKVTPFEVEIVYDDTLAKGEEVVLREGQNGIVKETHTVTVTNGVAGESKVTKTETIQGKVNKIIRVGTKTTNVEPPKVEDKEIVNTTTAVIPFEVEIITDPTLEAGKQVIAQEGQNGEKTITHTTKIVNGTVGNTLTSENITKYPVKKIVRVGTKTNSPTTPNTETRDIVSESKVKVPYGTRVIYDNTLDAGNIIEEQPGSDGLRVITTTTPIVNGVAGKPIVNDQLEWKPVDRVIRFGTKKATEGKPTGDNKDIVSTTQRIIPFETKIIYDESLKAGEVIELTSGENGLATITTTITLTNGVAGNPVITEKIIKEPVTRVIRVGKKPNTNEQPSLENQDVVSTKTVEIPFGTEIIYDDTLEAGKVIEEQMGRSGERTITTTITIINGIAGEPVVREEVTKQPTKRIIRIGTKKPAGTNPGTGNSDNNNTGDNGNGNETPTNPGGTGDDNNGGSNNGSAGTVTDPSVTPIPPINPLPPENPPINPVGPNENETIVVNPTESNIIDIPHNTVVITDNNLPEGESKLELKGRDGEGYINSDGELVITRQPVNEIIRVGTKPIPDGEDNISKDPDEKDYPVDNDGDTSANDKNDESDENDGLANRGNDNTDIESSVDHEDDSISNKNKEDDLNTVVDTKDDLKVINGTEANVNVPSNNPKTGIAGSSRVLATLALAMGGLYAGKKKEDEDK